MFSVQGPNAGAVLREICGGDLSQIPRFGGKQIHMDEINAIATRTGYTGEDGFEILTLDASIEQPAKAITVWNTILDRGKEYDIQPCGLGARDVLRLEAGMCLYGNDIDESITPIQAKLGFVVKLTNPSF
jgi:aminomethyltransferase